MAYKFEEQSIKIQSQKTEKIYTMSSIGETSFSEDTVDQITNVCDEPEVYDNVFASVFKGKRYTKDNARFFVKLLQEGLVKKDRFDWLIFYEGNVVGTIGIKSLEGEIGYWQSRHHPGVMTSALKNVCSLAKEAGFKSLWAQVDQSHIASIKVLEGAGFQFLEVKENIKKYQREF
ncbi:MAG: GNAT family N-acetyltransferase [Bacteriovoracaceae bacterium]